MASDSPWTMHVIDNPNFRLPNGLDSADADGDGWLDLLTNYEWNGYLRIAFRPPRDVVAEAWPAVTVGRVPNAESSCFGDVDGDGDPDVVVAHGAEALGRPGVKVLLNPEGSRAREAHAWGKPIEIPAARGIGHFHYIRCRDLDSDGRLEIVVGGRGKQPRAGLRVLSPPSGPAAIADFSRWTLASIDPNIESAHGFQFGDLDGDGLADIVVHLENAVYLFRTGGSREGGSERDQRFDRIVIPKPEQARWRARMIRLGDVDGDGMLEMVGALIHHAGKLPSTKAAVFWMDVAWKDPAAPALGHVVKWGSDFPGACPLNGEKWDQAVLDDIDGDGDLDIAANCEEFDSPFKVHLAVVWFENPLR